MIKKSINIKDMKIEMSAIKEDGLYEIDRIENMNFSKEYKSIRIEQGKYIVSFNGKGSVIFKAGKCWYGSKIAPSGQAFTLGIDYVSPSKSGMIYMIFGI